ncbi:carbapenam-3-carboxylate synthase [Xenorhabdus japonica]|uniref:asparagine synthase (glutamine-hydrolyzing) n=1 Tax=Xenorhabdus japonica TaxID=53341 RepID=A0A1I5BL16_9GAMM|nr:carbapenam-3-carboxylate synthase [Xenorhabdus japonica]SFN75316.1 carbapenam-3-carboxylate synthase [Xenorhabdus japonica]
MGSEFCFIKYGTDKKSNKLINDFEFHELFTGIILFRDKTNVSKFENEKYNAFLIGNIYNISTIRSILGTLDGRSSVLSDVEVVLSIREKFGNSILSIAEGDYCLFIEDKKGNLEVITESRGLNLVNLVQTDSIWITNSLKIVGIVEEEKAFDFKPEIEIVRKSLKPDNFSPIRNVSRLKPGTINKLAFDTQGYPYLEVKYIASSVDENSFDIKRSVLLDIIDSELRSSISRLSKNNETIGIPLSGGLDSSLVTALSSQYFNKIKTWSIGTELSNEFEFSQIVSDHLGTEHEIKILSEDEIISGIVKSIYHNEIFDGLSSEIQSGLFNIYELAKGKVNSLITGYGSDLLFGGILEPRKFYIEPNKILSEQVYRTKWTGEFSTHGAVNYGLNVYHPFWTNNLISLCNNLDPYYKIRDNEVKNILREYADSINLLPKEIVWRKKIGIHEGSSVNKSFAKIIGTEVNNYQDKTRFSYSIYKEFLTGRLSIEEANQNKLREIIKRN